MSAPPHELATQLLEQARSLIDIAQKMGGNDKLFFTSDDLPHPNCTKTYEDACQWAKNHYKIRKSRAGHFGNIFSDPLWDMIVDLFIARCEGKMISITSSCIAADVPISTGLRHISFLMKKGALIRVPDINDRRREFLILSDAWFEKFLNYFEKEVELENLKAGQN